MQTCAYMVSKRFRVHLDANDFTSKKKVNINLKKKNVKTCLVPKPFLDANEEE
jgi:hypothetical protein